MIQMHLGISNERCLRAQQLEDLTDCKVLVDHKLCQDLMNL